MSKLKRFLLTSILGLSLVASVGVSLVKGAEAYADTTYTDFYTAQTADASNAVIKVIVNDIKCVTDPNHARPWIGDVMYFGYSYNDTYGPSSDLSALPVEYKEMYAKWGDTNDHTPEDLARRATMTDLTLEDVEGYTTGACKDADGNYVVYNKVAKDADTGFFMRARVGYWIESFQVRKSTDNGTTWTAYEDPRGTQGLYDNIYSDEYGYRIQGAKANTLYEIKVTISEWPANTKPIVTVKNVTRSGDTMTVDCNLTSASGDYATVVYGISVDGNVYLASVIDGLPGAGVDASGNFSVKVKVAAERDVDVKGFAIYTRNQNNIYCYSYLTYANPVDLSGSSYVSDYTADVEVGAKVDLLGSKDFDMDAWLASLQTDEDTSEDATTETEATTEDSEKNGCKGAIAMLSAFMGVVALAIVGKKY